MDQDFVSFVLRFVREAGENQQTRWRGIVKHVQSDSEATFSQFSEAMAFMQGYVNEVVMTGIDESKRMGEEFAGTNPFMETARLWGDFMPNYNQAFMDSMADASGSMTGSMEQMMEATRAFWGMPAQAKQSEGPGESVQNERVQDERDQIVASLEAMTKQISELTTKVAELENQLVESKEKTK